MYKESPIFYMGNKYKLLKDIVPIFPKGVETFVDLFGGSGVVSMNYKGTKNTFYNEYNHNIVNLIKLFKENKPQELDEYFKQVQNEYGLKSFSIPTNDRTKEEYKLRQVPFNKLRKDYNDGNKDIRNLYMLICYSINNLIRFNQKDEFNAPSGSGCYSDKVYERMINFHNSMKDVTIVNGDAFDFDFTQLKEGDFVYCDPPYLNTQAVYNEKRAFGGWGIEEDYKLFELLENLNSRGIKWALSNVFVNRGNVNQHLIDWCEKNKWSVIHLNRNYSPFSKGGSESDEVFITNYLAEPPRVLSLI